MQDPRIGTVIDGHRIEERLGEGGMGVVYRAQHLLLKREVALKVIRPELSHDADFRQRFRSEMEIAAAIEHEHVVRVHGAADMGDGGVYLTMQLVKGEDLQTLLDKRGPYEPRAAAEVIAQIAGALDSAHALGLVHRDVKPANILLTFRDRREHAFLSDFGLAKRAAPPGGITPSRGWVGTIDYAPPEQIFGPSVDARSDVYALGCVLFRMLTGEVPFPEKEMSKAFAHAGPRPTIASSAAAPRIAGSVAAALDAVITRAIAIAPAERYTSAGDFGRAVVAAANGRPAPAPEGSVARGEAATGLPTGDRPRSWPRFWQPKPRDPGSVRSVDGRFVAELALLAVLFILSYSIGARL